MNPLVVYVDVDDTFVRSAGTKRMLMRAVVKHIEALHASGAELYCWSTGGAAYAEESAREARIHHCFRQFLPKPNVILDDQAVAEWRSLVYQHPLGCSGTTIDQYAEQLKARK